MGGVGVVDEVDLVVVLLVAVEMDGVVMLLVVLVGVLLPFWLLCVVCLLRVLGV